MSDAVALIRRIRAATAVGPALGADDAAALHAAIDVAICEGGPLEAALGLSGKWRQAIRREDAAENLMRLLGQGRQFSEAKRLHRELKVYDSGEYRKNLDNGRVPIGARGAMHEFLIAYGSVPSLGTLRRLIENNSSLRSCYPVGAQCVASRSEYGKANISTDTRPRSLRENRGQAPRVARSPKRASG